MSDGIFRGVTPDFSILTPLIEEAARLREEVGSCLEECRDSHEDLKSAISLLKILDTDFRDELAKKLTTVDSSLTETLAALTDSTKLLATKLRESEDALRGSLKQQCSDLKSIISAETEQLRKEFTASFAEYNASLTRTKEEIGGGLARLDESVAQVLSVTTDSTRILFTALSEVEARLTLLLTASGIEIKAAIQDEVWQAKQELQSKAWNNFWHSGWAWLKGLVRF